MVRFGTKTDLLEQRVNEVIIVKTATKEEALDGA